MKVAISQQIKGTAISLSLPLCATHAERKQKTAFWRKVARPMAPDTHKLVSIPDVSIKHRRRPKHFVIDFRALAAQILCECDPETTDFECLGFRWVPFIQLTAFRQKENACSGSSNRHRPSLRLPRPAPNAVSRWISNWLNLIQWILRRKNTHLSARNAVSREPI